MAQQKTIQLQLRCAILHLQTSELNNSGDSRLSRSVRKNGMVLLVIFRESQRYGVAVLGIRGRGGGGSVLLVSSKSN